MKRCKVWTADGLLVCDGRMKDCAAAIGVTVGVLRNYVNGWNRTPGGLRIETGDWPFDYRLEEPANLCPCSCCVQNMHERCGEEDEPCARFKEWFCGRWPAVQRKFRRV